jgi:hypothetical protein
LDVSDGFGEYGIDGDQVFDGVFFLMVMFARFLSEDAICWACLSLVA